MKLEKWRTTVQGVGPWIVSDLGDSFTQVLAQFRKEEDADIFLRAKNNMGHIANISKIIDEHRAEEYLTCPEHCWCWDVEAAICGHGDKSSRQDAALQSIRMLKTLSPEEIPNGTLGVAYDDITTSGLHKAEFNGFSVFVYGNEVELIPAKGGRNG